MRQLNNEFNVLYVLNQNVDLKSLCEDINFKKYNTILILSTCLLFDNEIEYIKININYKIIEFKIFSDYIDDKEMELCDINSSNTFNIHTFDVLKFMNKSMLYKNIIVRKRVLAKNKIYNTHCLKGLGIASEVWQSEFINLSSVNSKIVYHNFLSNIFKKILSKITRKIYVEHIIYDKKKYLFTVDANRLKIKNDAIRTKRVYNYFLFSLLLKLGSLKVDYFASTIHNYNKRVSNILLSLNKKHYIFIDGNNPSNMPRTYLDIFSKNCVFVVKDFIDKKWFEKFGLKILSKLPLSKDELMIETSFKKINDILLILGHAGDWSSLINRSDTDISVREFANLAKKFPYLRFTIRTHPAMVHPSHEGINSIKRIEQYVKFLKLKNLTISNNTLDKDIKENDLFLSEYSNAFIDCLKKGKLGLIINFTNRRSFMTDYAELEFEYLDSPKKLPSKINEYIENQNAFIVKQNKAVFEYNKKQYTLYQGT